MRKSLYFLLLAIATGTYAQTNNALTFAGTGSSVSIPDNPALDITSDITIEMWIYLNTIASGQEQELMDKANDETTNYRLLLWNPNGAVNNTRLGFWNSATTVINSTNFITSGIWTHVAVTVSSGSATLYINGVPSGTFPYTVGPANDFPVTLGKHTVLTTRNFNGIMDEVRIWNVARTPAQIKQTILKGPPANASGLVAWYRSNETSGPVVNSSTNTTGIDGTINGTGVSRVASSIQFAANALAMDGTDDNVLIGMPLAAGSSYTKEAWVYVADPTQPRNVVSSFNCPVWISPTLRAGNNKNIPTVTDPTNFPANTWTHVAVTYNATTQALTLYRNGVQVATATETHPTVAENNYIGAWFNGASTESYLGGMIDEVRIWNVARTQAEIQANMNQEIDPVTQTNLVAYYTMDQGLSAGSNPGLNVLLDQKGNFNGTLTNMALTGSTSNFVVQKSDLVVLPVVWLSFTAQYDNHDVLLQWSTAMELNNRTFTVQHSTNGTDWTDLSSVPSQGNSRETQRYSYTHNNPPNGINYYRIKQTDIDGAATYSKINTVNVSEKVNDFIVLNTVVSNGSLQVQVSKPVTLMLFNDKGSLLAKRTMAPGRQAINVSRYGKGAFFVKSEESVVKIIIQ